MNEIPTIDQYVRLLILKSRVYQLDSKYVVIADFDHSLQGKYNGISIFDANFLYSSHSTRGL